MPLSGPILCVYASVINEVPGAQYFSPINISSTLSHHHIPHPPEHRGQGGRLCATNTRGHLWSALLLMKKNGRTVPGRSRW